MAELNSQFGKNIKYLRTAYEETQFELVPHAHFDGHQIVIV